MFWRNFFIRTNFIPRSVPMSESLTVVHHFITCPLLSCPRFREKSLLPPICRTVRPVWPLLDRISKYWHATTLDLRICDSDQYFWGHWTRRVSVNSIQLPSAQIARSESFSTRSVTSHSTRNWLHPWSSRTISNIKRRSPNSARISVRYRRLVCGQLPRPRWSVALIETVIILKKSVASPRLKLCKVYSSLSMPKKKAKSWSIRRTFQLRDSVVRRRTNYFDKSTSASQSTFHL